MEMEKKEEMREEQQEDETSPLVRKSRNVKSESAVAIEFEVSNVVSESNGHTTVAANGAHIEKSIPGEEQETVEEPDDVLEVAMNGSEDRVSIPGDEPDGVLEMDANGAKEQEKIEDLDWVLENLSEARNEEKKTENLVFYDKIEGIWKCRICSWTYRNGNVCVDHIQNHRGQMHKLMSVKTLNFEFEGVGSTYTHNDEKQILKVPVDINEFISSLDSAAQKNGNFYGSNIEPSQNPLQDHAEGYKSSEQIESVEVDLINEDDLEVTGLEVERVLQKQTTHDLYCPNCNSCITKRVILRKRKRRIQISDEDGKRNKKEAAVASKLGAGTSPSASDQVQPTDETGHDENQLLRADEDERNRCPNIFRCLSCFSFFVPIGNGLVRLFRERNGKENVADEQTPNVKKNKIPSPSMSASSKQGTAVVQESSSQTDAGAVSSSYLDDQISQSSISQNDRSPSHVSEGIVAIAGDNDTQKRKDEILTFPIDPSLIGKVIISTRDHLDTEAMETVDAKMEQFDLYTEDQLKESKVSREVNISREILSTMNQFTTGESMEDAISFPKEDGLKLLISSNKGSPALENSKGSRIPNQTVQSGDTEANHLSPASASVTKASDMNGKLSMSVRYEEQDAREASPTESVVKNKTANFRSDENTGEVYHPEVSQVIVTRTKFEVHSSEPLKFDSISYSSAGQGKDAVITIDAQSTGPSQNVPDIIHTTETTALLQPATQSNISGSGRSEERKEFEIEVIKSIVYGGLAESITSLSVVSSAVGGGAAPLNILALGMANLIGGLFIICHNLWELRDECVEEQVSNQISDGVVEQKNRYKELLGRRQNFVLHATLAIISYLVFGLVPPVAYGFSFRKTDDKQLKLVVVAAVSLVCIVALAIGRAYVQRPRKPYLKSVMTFVILGFMVSGVSYAAGELVERLLVKLGLFQPGTVSNLLGAQKTPTGTGWATY